MKITLKCPLCNKTVEGDVPDDVCKKKGLTEGQFIEMPCPDCLSSKSVGAIAGAAIKTKNLCIHGKCDLSEKVEAMREYHKKVLKKDKEVPPTLFTVKGEDSHIFILGNVMDDKDKAELCIKAILGETNPDAYFMVTEAWSGTKLDVMPSKDPNRKEILLVYGQERGDTGIMCSTEFMKFDGEIRFTGPDNKCESKELSGRFINLLPTE